MAVTKGGFARQRRRLRQAAKPTRAAVPAAQPATQPTKPQATPAMGNQAVQRLLRAGTPPAQMVAAGRGALGNRAIQRLATAQRATAAPEEEVAAPAPTPAGNPLVGLKSQDGMTNDTIDRRPRVTLLQEKLNEKMLAGLKPDGKFGNKTTAALGDFQESVRQPRQARVDADTADALLSRAQPGPQPGPTPTEEPATNPLLEDTLDAVMAHYQIMLLRQRDGLISLERDLNQKPHPSFAGELLTAAIEGALEATLGPAHGLLSIPFKAIFGDNEHDKSLHKEGVSEVLAKMLEKAIETGLHTAESHLAKKTPSVEAFIDAQREALLDAAAGFQEQFLLATKPTFRAPVPGVPAGTGAADPRLANARKLLKGAKDAGKVARDDQYASSLATFASALAQGKGELGSVEADDPLQPGKKKKVTDLRQRKFGAGVLQVTIAGGDPETAVRVVGLRITGLPEPTLRKLEERGTIGNLNLPRRAVGDVRHRDLGGDISIAKNEVNGVLETGNSADGRRWLALKGGREVLPDGQGVTELALIGAKAVWQEIDGHDLTKGEIKG